MAPTLHSTFSASSSLRLLSCPGSFKLGQENDTGRKSSVYSAEGTLAHAIAEASLFAGRSPEDFVGQTRTADGFAFEVDQEFADAVREYVGFVEGLTALGYIVALEMRVSPQALWEGLPALPIDLFGTSDCVAYHPGTRHLVIGDLKFGKGIAVDAENNPQLLYYAAGSMAEAVLRPLVQRAGATYQPPVKVTTVIIQPRAYHRDGPVRGMDYTPEEVRDFARITLYNGVKRALSDNGQTLFAGKWCRFCPALVNCKAPRDLSFETAQAAFAGAPLENIPAVTDTDPDTVLGELTPDELGELLDKIEVIRPWLDAIVKHAMERAEKGKAPTGYKMVPKRKLRRWADDPEAILQTLDATGLNADLYSERAVLTPAQVEKRVGKKAYAQLIEPHVVKNSSGYTLAPEGDPRARVQNRTAQEAFSQVTTTTSLEE